jgi:hypothetical protein
MAVTISGSTGITLSGTAQIRVANHPAFHAMASTLDNRTVNGSMIYGNATFNTGGYYNVSTGVFVAPIDGAYSFSASAYSQNGTGTASSIQLRKNGVMIQVGENQELGGNQGFDGLFVASTIYLAAGDSVDVSRRTGSIHLNPSNNSFSGHLIA